jgi:hypothetical protein
VPFLVLDQPAELLADRGHASDRKLAP